MFPDLIGIDDVTEELVVAKKPSTPAQSVDAIMHTIARCWRRGPDSEVTAQLTLAPLPVE